tara:strand:+ start:148 stop:306 length:159 start_codon:yes stop_codon:yes gene_type:complete
LDFESGFVLIKKLEENDLRLVEMQRFTVFCSYFTKYGDKKVINAGHYSMDSK